MPAIVPVVLHHSARGWSASTTFEGLLDVDPETLAALGEHTVRLRFVLDDLSASADATLRDRAMTALGRLVLFCLRHARAPDELMRRLAEWRDVVAEVRRTPNGRSGDTFSWPTPAVRREDGVARLLEAAGEEAKEEVMTVGEMLIERGRKEGRIDGQRQLLLEQLRARFGDLPEAAVARVEAATSRQMMRWGLRVLTAATLDDVLGKR